jgi:hypothetical protein
VVKHGLYKEAASGWPLTAEARVRSRVIPFGTCGGHSGTETGFSPCTSVFPGQCHSNIVPFSASSTCCLYLNDQRAKPGNLSKSNALLEMGEHWIEKYFHLDFKRLTSSRSWPGVFQG